MLTYREKIFAISKSDKGLIARLCNKYLQIKQRQFQKGRNLNDWQVHENMLSLISNWEKCKLQQQDSILLPSIKKIRKLDNAKCWQHVDSVKLAQPSGQHCQISVMLGMCLLRCQLQVCVWDPFLGPFLFSSVSWGSGTCRLFVSWPPLRGTNRKLEDERKGKARLFLFLPLSLRQNLQAAAAPPPGAHLWLDRSISPLPGNQPLLSPALSLGKVALYLCC